MVRQESTVGAAEACFKVKCKLSLPIAWLTTLRARDRERATLQVEMKFCLAWKNALAADTLEVISCEMLLQTRLIRSVVRTAWLQTVFVFCATR